MMPFAAALLALLACLFPATATPYSPDGLAALQDALQQAVVDGRMPGGVFLMDHHGAVFQSAVGDRAIVPTREKMTADTIFDAASLTKPVATATAVMKLAEQGKLDLESPVARYLPEFSGENRETITLRQLLTHTSGLRAGIGPPRDRRDASRLVCRETLQAPAGTAYRYSDINFLLLGWVVEQAAGESLDAYCQREIFAPLAMADTRFRPLGMDMGELRRIAPTTVLPHGTVLRGVVHDPVARAIGGVAGHAGLFTTAADLARFGRMLLGGGELDGVRILKPETVAAMTAVQSPPGLPRRGFGWDIDSPYAGPRGALFPIGSFGHTGWTGTRLWVDPFSQTVTVFLSNRNHPDEKGSVIALQRQLGTLAARAITDFDFNHVAGALPEDPQTRHIPPQPDPAAPVLNGIDVLVRDGFRQLRGRKVGLITNHTGIDRQRRTTIDLLRAAPDVKLVALFAPEHGIRGELDQAAIADGKDRKTGLPIYSLYGKNRAPTPAQLKGIDTLVFDIQDIGCRFYTYISTLDRALEAAAKAGIRFVVLDRVNPVGPLVEGPVFTAERSFVGTHPIPLRHGMTAGELARLMNAEKRYGADLGVIRCEGGSPLRWFDETALPWINPSPNMRSLHAATLYPGVGLLEFCNLSVGRGTGTPFELVGAPYLDDLALATALRDAELPGITFTPVRFTPASSVFAGKECRGIRLLVTDRDAFRAADLGIVLAATLHRLHPKESGLDKMATLLGDEPTLDALRSAFPLEKTRPIRDRGLPEFERRRTPALLYPR